MSECYRLPCVSGEYWATLGLFTDVKNARDLRLQATRGQVKAALLEPTLLVNSFHVLCAVNKAVTAREQDRMKSATIYSEIIFSLSRSTHGISASFKSFGIRDTSQNVLVVMVNTSDDKAEFEDLSRQIEGRLVPLDQMDTVHSVDDIITEYKIPEEEMNISSLEHSVVTRSDVRYGVFDK